MPERRHPARRGLAGLAFAALIAATPGAAPLAAEAPWETWSDLRRLSLLHPGHQSLLRSSHCPDGCRFDRHSDNDWRYVRLDGAEGVIFEEPGAGAITRIWVTQGDGLSVPLDPAIRVRIYVDGAASPAVDVPLPELFDGSTPPFLPPLVGHRLTSSGGNYSYVPIPYREGCRVALVGAHEKKLWYQINFHRLADAGGVASFDGSAPAGLAALLATAPGDDPWPAGSGAWREGVVTLGFGESASLAAPFEPGALTGLRLRLDPALWGEIGLELAFDGRRTVALPLADFFAQGKGGPLPSRSLLVGLDDEGFLYSWFPMPFRTSAVVYLRHLGAGGAPSATVEWQARIDEQPPAAGSGTFGAALASDDATTPGVDFRLLTLSGEGKLAGLFLELGTITGTNRIYVEGDERFYLDGSAHPAVYGTGVEDIFNGGFAFDAGPFSLPLHGAPYTQLDEAGSRYTAAYRLMPTDGVTFAHRLEAGLEGGPTGELSMRARAVTWFYRRPAPALFPLDLLDLGDAADRTRHGYQVTGAAYFDTLQGLFESEPPLAATGTGIYRGPGTAQLTLVAHPTSRRFRLRRRLDAGLPRQRATVAAAAAPATGFGPVDVNADRRWREIDLDLSEATVAPGGVLALTVTVPAPDPPARGATYTAFLYELWGDGDLFLSAADFESGGLEGWRRPAPTPEGGVPTPQAGIGASPRHR